MTTVSTPTSPLANNPPKPPRIQFLDEFKPLSHSLSVSSPFALPPGCSIVCPPFEYPPSPFDWSDNVIRYDAGSDTLRLYFKQTLPESVKSMEQVTKELLVFVAKDEDRRICFMEFQKADSTLLPHTFDTTASINGQPPLQLSHDYDSLSNLFCIDLVSQDISSQLDIVQIHDPFITIIFDVEHRSKRICGFQVIGASNCIAKNKV